MGLQSNNRVIKVGTLLAAALVFSCAAQAQGFPIEVPKIGFPSPSDTSRGSSTGKKVLGTGLGCGVGGAAGYFGTKAAGRFLRKRGLSRKQVQTTSIAAAGVGCVVGGAVALRIIKNMDEKSKQAQEEAWRQAQANSSGEPVSWEGPQGSGYQGTVAIETAEPLPDGTTCITRKDYVLAADGEATVYNRYCKNENDEYELLSTAS